MMKYTSGKSISSSPLAFYYLRFVFLVFTGSNSYVDYHFGENAFDEKKAHVLEEVKNFYDRVGSHRAKLDVRSKISMVQWPALEVG